MKMTTVKMYPRVIGITVPKIAPTMPDSVPPVRRLSYDERQMQARLVSCIKCRVTVYATSFEKGCIACR